MTNGGERGHNIENKDQHNQDKTEPAENFFEQRMMEDLSSRNNDPDSFWMTLFKNNGNMPKPKQKEPWLINTCNRQI